MKPFGEAAADMKRSPLNLPVETARGRHKRRSPDSVWPSARATLTRCTLAFALASASGCGSAQTAPGDPSGRTTGTLPPAGESNSKSDDELPLPQGERVSFEDYLARVELVRNLKAKSPVLGLRVAEDQLIDHVERSFQRELPEHALLGTQDMLIALGTVPFTFNFRVAMLGLLRSQLAGLYDPRKNAMFVRSDLAGEELEATLLHELVHALQDQAYDLDEFSAYREDGTDQASALSALAEGDATSAMYDGMLAQVAEDRETQSPRTALELPTRQLTAGMDAAADLPEEADVPRIVRRSLIAPYRDGILFVHELRTRGGWAAVDDAWKHPPTSTEQILHIQRYLDREPPIATDVTPPPNSDWKPILTDIWGEQSVRLVFEEAESRAAAETRASGWGGDRIALFARGSERAATWHLITDDTADAERYLEGFRLLAGSPTSSAQAATQSFCTERDLIGPLMVARKGKHVIVLAGPYHRDDPTKLTATCAQSAGWMVRALTEL